MAVLSTLAKRKLLNSKEAPASEVHAAGLDMVAAGQLQDALALFAKSQNKEEIRKIREQSIADGDLFLYEACSRLLEEEQDSASVIRLGEKAKELGKLYFAHRAFRQTGKDAQAQELESKLAELMGAPPKPVESEPKAT